jgi:Transposase DDE domain
VVLAEYTQPFNEGDVTYFRPLYQRTVAALNQYPTHLTADAAFDAWYVYQAAALHGGIAAVPRNQHGHPTFSRDADGVPRCPKDLRMHPTYPFAHSNGYRAQLYRCPLLFPTPQAHACCDHPQFQAAKGCVKHINIELGGLMRITLDRSGPLYQALYTQRTCAERINSQAQGLGIERPKVRNKHSVANLNTFIYVGINAKVLLEAKAINRRLL